MQLCSVLVFSLGCTIPVLCSIPFLVPKMTLLGHAYPLNLVLPRTSMWECLCTLMLLGGNVMPNSLYHGSFHAWPIETNIPMGSIFLYNSAHACPTLADCILDSLSVVPGTPLRTLCCNISAAPYSRACCLPRTTTGSRQTLAAVHAWH